MIEKVNETRKKTKTERETLIYKEFVNLKKKAEYEISEAIKKGRYSCTVNTRYSEDVDRVALRKLKTELKSKGYKVSFIWYATGYTLLVPNNTYYIEVRW